MDWKLESWIEDNVPEKDTLSRDAVEILLERLWNEAHSPKHRADEALLERMRDHDL